MRLALVVVALLTGVQLNADINLFNVTNEPIKGFEKGKNRFTELLKLYDAASVPTELSLRGWHSGRAYWVNDVSTAQGALLVSKTVTTGENEGPLFPSQHVLKIFAYVATEPDYYDTYTPQIEEAVSNSGVYESEITNLGEVDKSLAFDYGDHTQWRVRIKGDFLLLKVVTKSDFETHKAGDTIAMSYYFKKIKD